MSTTPGKPRIPAPISRLAEAENLEHICLVATDVDGTLTRAGKLDAAALDAIWRLMVAGVTVVPVSGRPAGEVQGLVRYVPGVVRGLAENGLVEIVPDHAPRWLGAPTDRARLHRVGERPNAECSASLRLTATTTVAWETSPTSATVATRPSCCACAATPRPWASI